MKHILIALSLLVPAAWMHAAGTSRCSIRNGSGWNCAELVYTAEKEANGFINFSGCTEGQDLSFGFTPKPGTTDEYTLGDGTVEYSVNPFSDSSRAKLVCADGQTLICLYDSQGRLRDVLSPLEQGNGEKEAELKWTRRLKGNYITSDGKHVSIKEGSLDFAGKTLPYSNFTFNGTVTGIMEIKGNSPLKGFWEVNILTEGLRLRKVTQQEDFYGLFNPTGEEMMLYWQDNSVPRFRYASQMLLNDQQWRRIDKPVLRMIRNEILFHHGYVPQAQDLQNYLIGKDWYRPRESNDGVYDELSLMEKLNIELIKTAEALKDEYKAGAGADQPDSSNGFPFEKYQQSMLEQAENNLNYMKSLDDIRLVSYALVDVDGDGTDEVWVRGDEGQDYQGVYAIDRDGDVFLIQSSDARSELKFTPKAVIATGYYGDGEFKEFATMVKKSLPDKYCYKYVRVNNYSPDQKVEEEDYNVNGTTVTEKEYNAFVRSLGEPYNPQVEWHSVKR